MLASCRHRDVKHGALSQGSRLRNAAFVEGVRVPQESKDPNNRVPLKELYGISRGLRVP